MQHESPLNSQVKELQTLIGCPTSPRKKAYDLLELYQNQLRSFITQNAMDHLRKPLNYGVCRRASDLQVTQELRVYTQAC